MKLGRGGIREIEFFTQTRQLISGGRPGFADTADFDGIRALGAKAVGSVGHRAPLNSSLRGPSHR